ncbi:signal recognition particle-docking protein FtsY [Candidatus Dependentiae bacterium]|nr:signal recognition particle-docking protein FtsY [Candidatus Dependentiae bacterium]
MFKFIKNKINKVYNQFTKKISSIFTNNKLDEKFLKELKILLLSADTGITTTNKILKNLKEKISNKTINNLEKAKEELEKILIKTLESNIQGEVKENKIIMLVGINGTGKTTFAAKLANQLKNNGKKVLLVAADTFRAAAVEQLKNWGEKIGVEVFTPKENSDPASVIFDGVTKLKNQDYDNIIIDTAGRLQTKTNLMRELEKINRVIKKVLPEEKITTYLTVDSMLGQNSFEQAKIFKDVANLDGIILTKLDGTGKGGIVFSITEELNLPIKYITFGEKLNDIKKFEAKEFVFDLLND